jgi:hypothetical protein
MAKAKISDFRPQSRNANRHTQRGLGMLEKSMADNGFIGALTSAADGEIFDGSARLEVAYDRFGEEIEPIVIDADGTRPIIVRRTDIPSASDPKAKKLAIAANRIAQVDLDWDPELLKAIGEEIDISDLFYDNEIEHLFELEEEEEEGEPKEEDIDALAESLDNIGKVESRVKLGEIWQLGRHKIACGDSTIESNVRALLGDRFGDVGMVWADAPYGISIVSANEYVGGGNCNRTSIEECRQRKEQGKKSLGLGSIGGAKPFGSKDVRGSIGASNVVAVNKYAPIIGDDTIDTAVNAFNTAMSIAKDAIHIWWGGNYFASALPNSSCWIVWDKENTGNFADAELAWCNHKSAVRIFKHMWNGMVKASEHGQKRVHPTQKPIALCEWAFDKYGEAEDLIFDPFLGSAPSIIAAQKMEGDRTVYGFELSPDYCEVIIQDTKTLRVILPT